MNNWQLGGEISIEDGGQQEREKLWASMDFQEK